MLSRGTGALGIGKATALCAFSLSAMNTFPSTYAHQAVTTSAATPTVAAAETPMACGISDGDKRFGIQVVEDSGCKWGGLGCYNDHCRYCKVMDTPKSAHLESCGSFGASFPTVEPPTASTGVCEASGGDVAVGISAFTDADCLYGGLGCFSDHCRYCKMEESPFSAHFMDCPELVTTPGTIEPSMSTTSTPVTQTVTEPPVVITEAPETDPPVVITEAPETEAPPDTTDAPYMATIDPDITIAEPVLATEAPFTTTESSSSNVVDPRATVDNADSFNDAIPAPDMEGSGSERSDMGIKDPYNDMGDFWTTLDDGTSLDDGMSGTEEPGSEGSDFLSEDPDSDFLDPWETPQQSASFDDDTDDTEIPFATTEDSGSDDEVIWATAAPSEDFEEAIATPSCAMEASAINITDGFGIVTDTNCTVNETECISNVCRYCKVITTTKSWNFTDCAVIRSS